MEAVPKQFKACGQCRVSRYCSHECQRRDWKEMHAMWCGKTPKEVYEFFGAGDSWERMQQIEQEHSDDDGDDDDDDE